MATEKTTKAKSANRIEDDSAATTGQVIKESDPIIKEKPIIPREVDPNQIVTVRNGFQGKLVYKSKRTGERWAWDSFGAEQDMELSELKNARNSNKKFFINNWFMFDEEWIIDYLGLKQYYKNALSIQDFDSLFEKSYSEIEEVVSKLSDGQKKSVAYRAKQLIAEEKIDSNKVISTLEKCLDTELIIR
jgi:hypothetical protein